VGDATYDSVAEVLGVTEAWTLSEDCCTETDAEADGEASYDAGTEADAVVRTAADSECDAEAGPVTASEDDAEDVGSLDWDTEAVGTAKAEAEADSECERTSDSEAEADAEGDAAGIGSADCEADAEADIETDTNADAEGTTEALGDRRAEEGTGILEQSAGISSARFWKYSGSLKSRLVGGAVGSSEGISAWSGMVVKTLLSSIAYSDCSGKVPSSKYFLMALFSSLLVWALEQC
jgi:hypothetical protein